MMFIYIQIKGIAYSEFGENPPLNFWGHKSSKMVGLAYFCQYLQLCHKKTISVPGTTSKYNILKFLLLSYDYNTMLVPFFDILMHLSPPIF